MLTCALPAQQVFKSGVDVTQVDVTVVDRDGNPVSDLHAADFTVTVDGKPRAIVSAQFIQMAPSANEAVTVVPPGHAFSTNAQRRPGRLVALVIDQGNIRFGSERSVLKAAEGFLDRLTAADRVALLVFPAPGPVVPFTGDIARVKEGLRRVVPQARLSIQRHNIAATEALRIEDGDADTLASVIQREFGRDTSCPGEIELDARGMAPEVRQRSFDTIGALRDVFTYLNAIDGPKTMALISEGLILDQQRFAAGLPAEIEHLAAQARATVYVLRLSADAFDASEQRPFREMDQRANVMGLETIAGVTGGEMLTVVGTGVSIFDRIARETSATYLLGIETLEQDRNEKAHRLKVSVRRGRVQVRARRQLEAAAPANRPVARSADHSANEDIIAALHTPLLSTALPIRVSSYVLQDADRAKVRLLVAAEAGDAATQAVRMAVGYELRDTGGKIVASHSGPVTLRPGTNGRVEYREEFSLPPGDYTYKLAVADAAGRIGTVDHSIRARLARIDAIEAAELLLNDERDLERGTPVPVEALIVSGRLSCVIDLRTAAGALPADTQVIFELVDSDGKMVMTGPGQLASDENGVRHVVRAGLDTSTLLAGDYVAHAVLRVAGRSRGEVTRGFQVVRSPAIK